MIKYARKMINLEELYNLQKELDLEIAKNHNVSYETTHAKRLLALIVEFGELANETRCFKYWSNKPSSAKEVVMDEYADGIHFLLSLGIPLHAHKYKYELKKEEKELTVQILEVYSLATKLLKHYNLRNYTKCFQKYLNLAPMIGMSEQDIIDSYKSKLSVNHHRQETNY